MAASPVEWAAVPESPIDLAARAAQLRRPAEGLTAIATLRRQLDELEAAHVRGALGAGWSWSRIAQALGVSRQAAHKKHARRAAAPPPASPSRAGRMVVTAQARRCVRFAREEADRLGLSEVAAPELLLGLVREGHGPAARTLLAAGLTLERLRGAHAAEASEPSARADGDRVAISPAARRVFEASLGEAVRLRDGHLGPEHILLAILRGDSAAAVARLGMSPVEVERRLERALQQPSTVLQPAPPRYDRAPRA
jgi:hypothetical protein